MTIDELKEAMNNKTPVFIANSWRFDVEPTIIISVKENDLFGGIVKVENSNDSYEGYRVRIANIKHF